MTRPIICNLVIMASNWITVFLAENSSKGWLPCLPERHQNGKRLGEDLYLKGAEKEYKIARKRTHVTFLK